MSFSERLVENSIRPYFDKEEWNALTEYEKKALFKSKENYEALIHLGFKASMPYFMKVHSERQKNKASNQKIVHSATTRSTFKVPSLPKSGQTSVVLRNRKPFSQDHDKTKSYLDNSTNPKKINSDICIPKPIEKEDLNEVEENNLKLRSTESQLDILKAHHKMTAIDSKVGKKVEKCFLSVLEDSSLQNKVEENTPDNQIFLSSHGCENLIPDTSALDFEKSNIPTLKTGSRIIQANSLLESSLNVNNKGKGNLANIFSTKESAVNASQLLTNNGYRAAVHDDSSSQPFKRYPTRNIAVKNYEEPELLDEDMYIYCDFCNELHEGYCPHQEEVILVKDVNVSKDKNDELRALKTIPEGLTIAVSEIPDAGDGIWSLVPIKMGTHFGPYDGIFRKNVKSSTGNYSWLLKKDKKSFGCIDGFDISQSNWMRFVNCARSSSEQNLVAYQYKGGIYYRVVKDIPPHQELLVYYGESLGKQLGITNFNSQKSLPRSVFACPHCSQTFSSPLYVERHAKYCRHHQGSETKTTSPAILFQVENNLKKCTFDVCCVCKKRLVSSSKILQKLKQCCDVCVLPDELNQTKELIVQGETSFPSETIFQQLYFCAHCYKAFIEKKLLRKHLMYHMKGNTFTCVQHPEISAMEKSTTLERSCSSIKKKENFEFSATRDEEKIQNCEQNSSGAERIHRYEHCPKMYTHILYLKKHLKLYTGEEPYSCQSCSKKFIQSKNLKNHLKIKFGEKLHSCQNCSETLVDSSTLINHLELHFGEKLYSCQHCLKKMNLTISFKSHLRVHTGEKPYSCQQCSKKFNRLDILKSHLRVHTGEKPYSCQQCSKKFNRLGHLKSHLRVHTGEKPYSCQQCSKKFNRLDILKSHLRVHTGEKPYSCQQCSKKFNQLGGLKRHLRVHTGEKPYSCQQCSKKFNESGHLKSHLRVHTGEKPYSCQQCSKKFNRLGHLKSHLRVHTGEKPYSCQQCSKKFNESGHLKSHLRVHTGEKPYSCQQCSKKFNRLDILKSHLRVHTGEKPYSCQQCSKKFNQLGGLKRHLRVHTGEKPYSCQQCSKKFNRLGHLKSHLRVHTGEKPYSCQQCSKKFNRLDILKSHLRVHTGEKPYSCQQCSKKFNQLGGLKRHLRVHTGEKPYSCQQCSKKFNESGHLKSHLRVHTGEKPYSCQQCSKKFNRLGHLKSHLRVHTGEKPYSCQQCSKKFNESGHLKSHLRVHTGEKPYSCQQCSKKFSHSNRLKSHLRVHTGEK